MAHHGTHHGANHGSHAAAAEFNALDPHGAGQHGQHETHHIVPPFVLASVLALLLLFTGLTVGLAQLEVAIADWLNITLPWWVNVLVAMSIACVKAALVMAFFMQLRYDNPMNTMVMAFCFFATFLFLFFTSIDLFNRNRIYDFKGQQVITGGTGSGVTTSDGKPMVIAARDRYLAKMMEKYGADEGKKKFDEKLAQKKYELHGHKKDHGPTGPSPNRAGSIVGPTGALETTPPGTSESKDAHHGSGH